MPRGHFALTIVSAGYGVVHETEWLVPYDSTFVGLTRAAIRDRAERLRIRETLCEDLSGFDVALFLLGKAYLEAIDAPLAIAPLEVYFAPPAMRITGTGVIHIAAGAREARYLHSNTRMVKVALFERLIDLVLRDGWDAALIALMLGDLGAQSADTMATKAREVAASG